MVQQTAGPDSYTTNRGAAQDFGPAAERLTEALGDLDRRYQVTQRIKDHPWPAIAVAAGVGFALAESSLDRGASTATAEATSGIRSSASTLVDELAGAATGALSQMVHSQLQNLVDELKKAIGAPGARR